MRRVRRKLRTIRTFRSRGSALRRRCDRASRVGRNFPFEVASGGEPSGARGDSRAARKPEKGNTGEDHEKNDAKDDGKNVYRDASGALVRIAPRASARPRLEGSLAATARARLRRRIGRGKLRGISQSVSRSFSRRERSGNALRDRKSERSLDPLSDKARNRARTAHCHGSARALSPCARRAPHRLLDCRRSHRPPPVGGRSHVLSPERRDGRHFLRLFRGFGPERPRRLPAGRQDRDSRLGGHLRQRGRLADSRRPMASRGARGALRGVSETQGAA